MCFSKYIPIIFFRSINLSHLRSLILTGANRNNAEELKSILPLTLEVTCFRLLDFEHKIENLLPVVSMRKLRTLSVRTLNPILISSNATLPINNVTSYYFSIDELYHIFQCSPLLQMLY